jgi:hypothetical protein
MERIRSTLAVIAAVMLAAAACSATTPVSAKSNTGAIIGGLIVGAAVGAAVSSEIKHSNKVYVASPPPDPWGKSFSPKPGVFCYPAQRACYNASGAYNANWTWKVYTR